MFHNINLLFCEILLSLPSRERGLKYLIGLDKANKVIVAPFAGAWIEIIRGYSECRTITWSLPSRERGLKFQKDHLYNKNYCRSLRGSVD